MMLKLLMAALGALLLLWIGGEAASAHETRQAPSTTEQERREAQALTERLRQPLSGVGIASSDGDLVNVAAQRQALLESLARNSPRTVLTLALTPAERAALPAAAQAKVEQPASATGQLRVLHIDRADGTGVYDIRLADGRNEREVAFGVSLGTAKPGDRMTVNGLALSSGGIIVAEEIIGVQGNTDAPPTGPQRTAVILINAPSASGPHPNADKTIAANNIFSASNPKSARSYYSLASYGQTTIVGGTGTEAGEGSAADIYGPYNISVTSCEPYGIMYAALPLADAELDYNRYDRVVISLNTATCGGGVGSVNSLLVGNFDGQFQIASVSWIFGNQLAEATLNGKIGPVTLHEFGHNLGIWHASALECGSQALGAGDCSVTEYDDPADVMGSAFGLGHPNAPHKQLLGWLGSSRLQTVTTTNTYTLNAYEEGTANLKAIRIPRTRDGSGTITSYYYLEYRHPASPWADYLSYVPGLADTVLVHMSGERTSCSSGCGPDYEGGGGGSDSLLIDTKPASIGGLGNDLSDAGLANGQSYTDAAAGVSITVTATSASSATVSVTMSTPARRISTTVAYQGMGTVTGGGVYAPTQSVTLQGVPVAGYNFAYWREDRSYKTYPNPYTFTVAGDRWLEAVFVSAPPAPFNDDLSNELTISSLPSSIAIDVSGAGTQSGEPTTVDAGCGGSGTMGHTAWYKYTAPVTSTLTLNITSSTFDTVLGVYTGSSVAGLSRVGCNDNASGGVTSSRLTVPVTAGTTYHIQIGGLGSAYGNAVLAFSGPADLGVTLTDGQSTVAPGAALTYSMVVSNAGPSNVTSALVTDTLPVMFTGATWTCTATTDSQCGQASGSGNISTTVSLVQGGSATYTISGTVSPSATGILGNTVVVGAPGGITDPSSGNNVATDTTTIATPALSCSPRPAVQVSSQPEGSGRLRVTLTATSNAGPQNTLQTLRFGTLSNAVVDQGGQTGLTSGAVVNLPPNTTQTTFLVRRTQAGQAVTVPVVVADGCGDWPTFVGGGASSF